MITMSSGSIDLLDTDFYTEEEKEVIRKQRAEEEERLGELYYVYINDEPVGLYFDAVKDLFEQLKEIIDAKL